MARRRPATASSLGWGSIPCEQPGALAVGWHLGGVAMAAFGVIVLLAWRRARHDDAAGLEAVTVVAAACIVFGTAAFVMRSFAPFFLIFIIPGVALAACVGFRRRLAGGARTIDRPR